MAAESSYSRVHEIWPGGVIEAELPVKPGAYTASEKGWLWDGPAQSFFELYIIAAGTGRFTFTHRSYDAGEGDVLLSPPGHEFSIEKTGRGNLVLRSCHLSFAGTCWQRTWDSPDEAAHFLHHIDPETSHTYSRAIILPEHFRSGPDPRLLKMHAGLIRLSEAMTPAHEVELAAKELELLIHVSRKFLASLDLPFDRRGRGPERSPHVTKAIRFINSHVNDPISLRDVAEALDLSDDYLSRIFRDETNHTIGEMITGRKMGVAMAKLLAGERTVKEIAAELGYRDSKYFSRLFKDRGGMNPRDYIRHEVRAHG